MCDTTTGRARSWGEGYAAIIFLGLSRHARPTKQKRDYSQSITRVIDCFKRKEATAKLFSDFVFFRFFMNFFVMFVVEIKLNS